MTENKNNIPTQIDETPLESWKEIAVYLKRDVRTVIRWEKKEGLPVRRHLHQARSSVYAYPSELETWRASRHPGFDQVPFAMPWRRPIPALGLTAVLLLALLSVASGPILTPPGALAQESGGMVARQVWAGPRVDILGAPSPDGRYLSYVDWETGDQAVRDFATGENRRLTNKGTWFESSEFALFSTMSPDSQQVAYAWFNEDFFYDLRIVGLHGSEPRVLYSNKELPYLQPAAWSPDGKHILANFFRKDRTNQIVMVSIADGSVRVLKTLDWRYPQKMSFSPDGRYIVYDFPPKEDAPERDIFLLATDGSREIPLVEHPANDLVPVWAPDGKSIVFSSDRTGTMASWVLHVTEGKPGGSPELVKQDIGRRALPLGFTQKGSFYYGLETGMTDVYVATLELATGKFLAPPRRATQAFVGANTSPDWSPDGKYLAYVSQRGRAPFGLGSHIIAIRSVETGQERELSPKVNPQRHYGTLRWSPDGRSLLVLGRDKKGRQGLYQLDADTGAVTPLVQVEPGVYIWHAVWSRDGRTIFYTRNDLGTKSSLILVHDLATGREKELYRAVVPGGIGRGLAVSPDGRQLAFITGDQATRSTALKVMPAAGGETRELLRAQEPEAIAWNAGLAWTPDGREVLFGRERSTSLEDQTVELWRISAEGGEPEKLELAMENLHGLRFHPDGRRIVFTAGQRKAEVWVMENFLPKLETKAARMEDE